ncbi:hypothetical protein Ndes2526B_g06609 [Nannochloris sp. 'desiccata']|nr:putative G3BP-like protein [Chlorella desiccata (nom. nud.)]
MEQQATPAQTVGNQFVSQYYTVLHSSPKHLHRFYSDRSTMTYADVIPEGDSITQNLKTATGQKMIHETVMNLGYEDTMTEIYSVDSQYSKGGSVVVQVTGALQAKGKDKRPFVQTFFLAVQEKGYFVMNDIFRYLLPPGIISEMLDKEGGEGDEALAPGHASVEEKTEDAPSTSATLDMEGLTINENEESSSPSSASASASALEAARAAAAVASKAASNSKEGKDESIKDLSSTTTTITKELQRQTSGGPSAVPAAPGVTVPFGALVSGEIEGGTSGANGVSIVYGEPTRLTDNDNSERHSSPEDDDTTTATSTAPPKSGSTTGAVATTTIGSRSSNRPPPPPPRPDGSTSVSVSSMKSLDSPGHDSMEPPPTEGVFIRDIPQAVTLEQLAEALSHYGPIAAGTLSLKTQQNRDSYAFVDYQHAEDAAECLAHGIEFYGRKVTVETKRPHIFKSSGGAVRNNNSSANSHSSSMSGGGGGGGGLVYPSTPMHMQYPTSPMHLQPHHYQQFYHREQQQHNPRGGGGGTGAGTGGSVGGLGAATGYSTNSRQHVSSNSRGGSMGGGNSVGGAGTPNQMQQMHARNAMPLPTAAAYQMATAGGYPMMMFNPGMAGMHGMTYIQMPPNQAAMMMADSSGVGIDGVYNAGMQGQGSRGGRGGGSNVGGVNGRYDSAGGRGGGRGGGGQLRGSDQQHSHSPYGRAALGQPMPYP